ncbi:MAG: DUF2949 domain-containing protein [Cyanobacteriota bacterium]
MPQCSANNYGEPLGLLARKDGLSMSLFNETSLEQQLLAQGIIDQRQLALARKVQRQQMGPLLMILLRLRFIDLDQMSGLISSC